MSSRLIISGLRSIEECLDKNPDRIAKILLPPGKLNPRMERIKILAQERKIRVEANPAHHPDEEPVLAIMKDHEYADFGDLVAKLADKIRDGERPVVVVLDGVTDPHNLGAILRTAAFMGVDGVVIPKDRSAGINETVYRIASGGVEHVEVAQVTNIVSALKELKDVGFWTVGFSEHAEVALGDIPDDFAPVIVIGNEEKGMRQLVRETCDHLVRLDPKGGLKSLNASVAASLAMAWATKIL